jgi:hypothetical protein
VYVFVELEVKPRVAVQAHARIRLPSHLLYALLGAVGIGSSFWPFLSVEVARNQSLVPSLEG